jgi:RecA-family ATPase
MTTNPKTPEPSQRRRPAAATPVRASELQVRPVEWLWPGRVPLGGLTVLAGEPGLGKSLLSIWLASRLSRGELGTSSGASLFLTAEDSREHTVLPRLVAAGRSASGSSSRRRRRTDWSDRSRSQTTSVT